MLLLCRGRRFSSATQLACVSIASADSTNATISSNCSHNTKQLEEPALIKLKNERDPEKLFGLFKENAHNRLVIENRFAFEDTVSRLAGARRFDYIEHLLEHQKALPQGRREGFIIRIIMLYGKAGMIKHAIDTFYNMHLYGCKRSVKSCNAALKVLAQTRDLDAIKSLLEYALQNLSIVLDIFSVNIVIKGFCEMSMLEKAYLFMVEMEEAGIKPDVITFTTLISAFYKNNHCEIGNGFWNLMIMKGCLPNIATFNVRIQFLVNKGRAWQANSLMGKMRFHGVKPDEVTYNLVLKGFCQGGFLEMAMSIYSAFHQRGYRPNVKIYQTMVHYLCEAKEYDLAYSICKASMKNNWFPNINTLYKLIDGLSKNGKAGKANAILIFVQNRVPAFSRDQLSTLESLMLNVKPT